MFKQKSDTAPAATAPADPVQRARTRARQRLIGAIVLLVIGVIGFPLVFETQPRPIPVDIPIEIPKKDALPPLAAPAPALDASSPAVAPATRPRPTALPAEPKPAEEIVTESRNEAGREVAPHAATQTPAAAASTVAEAPRRTVAVASAPARAAASAPTRPAEPKSRSSSDGERARALLEGGPASSADASRFVVQVGAFADAEAARETRLKVEKLGFKTYTQVAQTPAGSRIRVRVGPFASRGEAEAALAKAKTAGLAAVVLTL